MNRERAKELLPIIQAFAEGKEIQSSDRCRKLQWEDCPEPNWVNGNDYRIKPEPVKTVPYRRYTWDDGRGQIQVGFITPQLLKDLGSAEKCRGFVAWIDTDWQTHEIPQE